MLSKKTGLNITYDIIYYICGFMETIVRTRKIGGSVVATIPNDIAKKLDIRENELIEIDVRKPRKSFFGIMKKLADFREEDRFDRK